VLWLYDCRVSYASHIRFGCLYRYKSATALLRALAPGTGKAGTPAHPYQALLAGGVGGWLVWGNYSSVNFQIVMYLMSRVAVALVKLGAQNNLLLLPSLNTTHFDTVYPWLACGTWALVMWLFEYHPTLLHPSLTSSMVTLYHDANSSSSWRDFVPSPAAAAVIAYMLTAHWHHARDLLDIRKKVD
jgi:peroxisomal membrane protein 4